MMVHVSAMSVTFPAGLHDICCSIISCICLLSFVTPFVLMTSLLAIYLYGSEGCQVNYILSNDTIQCGYGNSLHYDGADIKRCPVKGEVLINTLTVWQIRDDELILYSQTLPPVNINGETADSITLELLGWQHYMWRDSVIAGFCCIANNNEDEKSASLHMFRDNDGTYNFTRGNSVRNAILSEEIYVPPKKTSCFQTWRIGSPFAVTHSSYHYIWVDLPANMSYTAKITVTQTFVNISDYPNSKPKLLVQDNHTHFIYPYSEFNRIDYLYICKAPPVYPEHLSEPDSVSLQTCTCNKPRQWASTIVTFSCVLFSILICVTSCICICIIQSTCKYTEVHKHIVPIHPDMYV